MSVKDKITKYTKYNINNTSKRNR